MVKHKKKKFKKVYWLFIGLAAALVVFILLLLYKPALYHPSIIAYDDEVSPYLTHRLLPQLYNGTQLNEPFDLTVTQNGINDIIVHFKWPRESGGIRFSAPKVFFIPDGIVLIGAAVAGGTEFIVTVEGKPSLDNDGLLNLRVVKVKLGAVNITLLVRVIAEKIFQKELAAAGIEKEDLQAQIAASLLNNEPFEPVFKIKGVFENGDETVRVEKITIEQEKLTLRLTAVNN